MNPQVNPEHYFSKNYDSKERFISYWHQIDEIISLAPESILEIGIGNGFVADYLDHRDLKVTTMDIDPNLKPDIAGSVLTLPFFEKAFEVVACFEVLEHLPYEDFYRALNEIHRVSRKYAVLSLPDVTRTYRLHLQLPKIGQIKRLISWPRQKPYNHTFDGEHYWEIGKAGYQLQQVLAEITRAGFTIKNTYQVFEFPYHRFFVLTKGMG